MTGSAIEKIRRSREIEASMEKDIGDTESRIRRFHEALNKSLSALNRLQRKSRKNLNPTQYLKSHSFFEEKERCKDLFLKYAYQIRLLLGEEESLEEHLSQDLRELQAIKAFKAKNLFGKEIHFLDHHKKRIFRMLKTGRGWGSAQKISLHIKNNRFLWASFHLDALTGRVVALRVRDLPVATGKTRIKGLKGFITGPLDKRLGFSP